MSSPAVKMAHAGLALRAGTAALVEAMRLPHWIKNGFVLLPLVFSSRLSDLDLLWRAAGAFAAFCLAASGVYLWNDALDWRADLNHPLKRTRPIPSGRLSPAAAYTWGGALLGSSLAGAFLLGRTTGALLGGYVCLQILYTLWLKHAMILDLMSIALGFSLRVLTGAAAVGVSPSHWLLICTFLLSLFLGTGKRRREAELLGRLSASHRPVLRHYGAAWLDQVSTAVCGATIVAYGLYTVAPETQARFGTDALVYTLPFVAYGLLRYLHLVQADDCAGDPARALLADPHLLVCVSAWALTCAAIIYL